MSSTMKPALTTLIPDCHRVNSHSLKLHPDEQRDDFLDRCAAWRGSVPQQPQDAYPETALQEPSSMDIFCIPPFWETTRDSDLTVRLISAQRSERRAESRLIQKRLKRVLIEHELYHHMDQHAGQRLQKADISVGVSRGVLRVSGLTSDTLDGAGSDVSSAHESDVE
ncbi:hypothetical protein C8R48DRAFT_778750 [Suillus tomentosus]|nr:hypothetical protein C8R48DRAFT_778750 [Suillus tomentosus]